MYKNGFSLREKRPIYWFKEVGSNVMTWGKDVWSTYLVQGFKEVNIAKIAAGVPMAIASLFAEAGDYALAGVADARLNVPAITRMDRDIGSIQENNVRHPIRTLLSGTRMITDLPMDLGDAAFGFTH